MPSRVHDRELLDVLEALPAEPYAGDVWRTTWKSRDPLVGSSSGGRWSPSDAYEVLYTSVDPDGSLAEVYYHLSQAPVFSSGEVLQYRLTVELDRMLRLTDTGLMEQLGIEDTLASRLDNEKSQAIGSAARFLDFQGLIVPSARWDCQNLVLFLDRLDLNEAIIVKDNQVINWPAWKEQHTKSTK